MDKDVLRMEENIGNTGGFSLESMDFVFRHPWAIVCIFLIVANIFHAYASAIPPEYRVTSILSFEAGAATQNKRAVTQENKEAAEKILSGLDINAIIEQALRDEPPAARPARYKELAAKLGSSKDGLSYQWTQKETIYLLDIGFLYNNPKICYRIVKAVDDTLLKASEQKVSRETADTIAFLSGQEKFYKEKLDAIDRETESVKRELVKNYPDLTDDEKALVTQSSSTVNIATTAALKNYVTHEEAASKLRDELTGLQKKRDRFRSELESGTLTPLYDFEDRDSDNAVLDEFASSISEKELEIARLIAGGYKKKHPFVVRLLIEINSIKQARRKYLNRMIPPKPGTYEYDMAREKMLIEIDDLDLRIGYLKESIEATDRSKAFVTTQMGSESVKEPIREKVAALVNLNSERSINAAYYMGMKQKLADAELKARTDRERGGFTIVMAREPSIPAKPDSSRAQKIIFQGLIIGMLLGVGAAYLLEKLNDPIRSDRELAEFLVIPVIGTINRIATAQDVESKRRQMKYTALGTAAVIIASRIIIVVFFS